MSWRDEYRQASFRNVEFHVESHSAKHSKRIAKHEFIERDGHYPEEMGAKAKNWKMSAYLVDENYQEQRNLLMTALDQPGAGVLIHPYLGEIKAICSTFTVSESSKEGGMCRFTIEFIEDGEPIYPEVVSDPTLQLEGSVRKVQDSSLVKFLDTFTVSGFPAFVAEAAVVSVQALTDDIEGAASFFFGEAQDITDLAVQINSIRQNIDTIVDLPEDLADAFRNSLALLGIAAGSTKASVDALIFMAESGDDEEITAVTPTRSRVNENKLALYQYVQSIAASSAAFYAANGEYESRDDAIYARTAIADVLDIIQEEIDDTSQYIDVSNVRTHLVKALPAFDKQLPVLQEVTPATTLPSLVLAHRLYNDATRGDEVAARNNVSHPGFLIGGSPLVVLSDE
ncbi:MAG: DNA circularization N-terminal domain-containing protein [Gammaproteobacteria bacterium]|nr:DNA circularization N-terminal domain-containing protein [Gammaproteobacteria bacterium]